MIDRRIFLGGTLSASLGVLLTATRVSAQDAAANFAAIEKAVGGRLGVCILDTGSGKKLAHRGDEHFALLSTFKALAAGCVLARVDRGEETLDRRVKYTQADVLSYAPVTKLHVAEGMTMADICDAAVGVSDNTAGNLMLASIGGPAGLTAWLRSIGDNITRLDRTEPTLNEAKPGDPRDTTTPNAMADTLAKLLTGDALKPASQKQLAGWLVASKVGGKRLRAGLPPTWRAGDKTGTNDVGCANDVAITWPPDRAPLIIASYLDHAGGTPQQRDAVHADVARIAAAWRG
jgi:beta-lactamase class A